MKKFYQKHELWFTLIIIAIYSVGQSFATKLNEIIGVNYAANAILNVLLTVFLLLFIFKNRLRVKYGLCRATVPAARFLFYLPLAVVVTQNLWNGFAVKLEPAALTCYIIYMFCVGIVEELLFRGLLFRAIAKDNIKTAIVISSVTFGLGHILNLINGVSSDVTDTLFQVVGAVAAGFLFVLIYYRGGSLLPCIIAHSAIDVASAFSNLDSLRYETQLMLCVVRIVVIVAYSIVLLKTLPKKRANETEFNLWVDL